MAKHTGMSIVSSALALALLAGVSTQVTAALTPDQITQINNAVGAGDPATALADVFGANVGDLPDLAGQAAIQAQQSGLIPTLCRTITEAASGADPDQLGDIAAAVIAAAPDCEETVAAVLAEGVQPAAGPTAPGAPVGPTPSPITAPSSTAESPSTDVSSPTTL